MNDLTVHRAYCAEHSARNHWLDENNHCHGEDLAAVESTGYSYAKHIGGGWFKMMEKYRPQWMNDLSWEMAAEAHDSLHAAYYEPDF